MSNTDAAKRCSERVNLATLCGDEGRWLAIRLSDGGSDGVTYDRRREAVAHQLHSEYCCYVLVPTQGMTVREAESFMDFNREAYAAGFRMTDPDDDVEPIQRLAKEMQ